MHDHLFNFYANKARDVINNRNFFETIYFTSLLTVLLPLTSQSVVISLLLSNFISTAIFLISLIVVAFLTHVYFELKYREYRWNYMQILIKHLYDSDIKKRPNPPTTYDDLCLIINEMTLFSPDHIMPILKNLKIYRPAPPPVVKNP